MRTSTFGAVGDIVLSGTAANDIRQRGTAWLLQDVLPILRRADVLFGNLECVILPLEFPGDQLDPRAMASTFDGTPALVDAGFDVLNLANNHILDGGTSGMFHTRDVVEARGIMALGVGADQDEARRLRVLERSGLRWGFLCYAEGLQLHALDERSMPRLLQTHPRPGGHRPGPLAGGRARCLDPRRS